jgi:hypothetical protein
VREKYLIDKSQSLFSQMFGGAKNDEIIIPDSGDAKRTLLPLCRSEAKAETGIAPDV